MHPFITSYFVTDAAVRGKRYVKAPKKTSLFSNFMNFLLEEHFGKSKMSVH
jgi:hypothetical protein